MKIKREISKNRYIIAFVLTSIVFLLGLALGLLFDNLRLTWAQTENNRQEVDYLSMQFQYLYLTSLEDKESSCAVLHTTMEKSIKDLSESLEDFIQYKEEAKINKEDYEIVERRYILDNLRYWLLANKAKEECNLDVVSILYFYSGTNCLTCPNQGTILSYFKKLFGDNLLVFPIDMDYEDKEPMLEILRSQHKLIEYPTLIIDGRKYEGIMGNEELKKIICESFEYEEEICP